MVKRILEIVTFPFHLLFLFVSFPFKFVKILLDDRNEKQRRNSDKILSKNKKEGLGEVGKFLFSNLRQDFKDFFNSYLNDKKLFIAENKELLEDYDNIDLDKLKPIEVTYIFGDSRQKLYLTDWRGEENEREIEDFLEDKLQIKTDWKNVNKLRKGVDEEKQRDGKFIIDLLKSIDKDLEGLNKRLVFLELGWDAYVYTAVDKASFGTITDKFGMHFQGSEKLKK